jgi:replicative DNA helicase
MDDGQFGRVPPNDRTAESTVLGSILLTNKVLSRVKAKLSPEDFYTTAHRTIYEAMLEVHKQGSAVDAVTVGSHLKDTGQLEKIGGVMTIAGLTDEIATTANIEHHAGIVRSMSAIRAMISAAHNIVDRGYGRVSDAKQYLNEARSSVVSAAGSLYTGDGPQLPGADIREILREIENKEIPEGIVKTGIENLDRTMLGLWPGILTIVAGRPGMGKSAFALNVATNAAMQGKKVLFFTLEDKRKYMVMRMLARLANVDLDELNLRDVDPESWGRIIPAAAKIMDTKNLWFEDTGGLKSTDIRDIAMSHAEEKGLDLAVIDHVGEIGDEGKDDTEIISRGTRNIRDLVKELNVASILVSQLNREVEKRPDKRPRLSDLKQAGKLEEAARVVLFPFRPGYYDGDEDRTDLQLWVAKATHGKTGMLEVFCDLSRMYMRAWDWNTDGQFPGTEQRHEPERVSGYQNKYQY